MIVDVLVPEIIKKVSYLCAHTCVKRSHPQLSVFVVVVLFLLALLQQVVCKIPENQIIISTYN